MTIHYFAADGNFGNATNLVIVDTTGLMKNGLMLNMRLTINDRQLHFHFQLQKKFRIPINFHFRCNSKDDIVES